MATPVKGNGSKFWPLWWTYHDQWQWMISRNTWGPVYARHPGHMHIWMMGFDAESSEQRAWSGNQRYEFELVEDWSPNSGDRNQQFNFRVVGLPKWYFYIEEFWRKVYVQNWDYPDNDPIYQGIVGKRGIKYDASKSVHTMGPFREGRDNSMFFTELGRALPIEYWRDEPMTVRDHYLRYGDGIPNNKRFNFNFLHDIDHATGDRWMIPGGTPAGNVNYPADDNWARQFAYADKFYIYPTIEYQKVVQLDWERPPGYQDRDSENEETGETFGDGYKVTIDLPFTKENVIQSPFSDADGTVGPPGTYYNGVVPEENKLHYVTNPEWEQAPDPEHGIPGIPYVPNERDPSAEDSGQPYIYAHPNTSWPTDGKWVEQFLGGVIQAKAKVICEDNWKGRFENWIHSTQFMVAEEFEGTDQAGPSS